MIRSRLLLLPLVATVACKGDRAFAGMTGANALTVGKTVSGELTDSDERLEEDGSFYKTYTYNAKAGERITVTLRSSDFDAHLQVGRGVECEWPCVIDDDGAGETDARVRMSVYQAVPLTIRVNTLTRGEKGRYTLDLETDRAPDVPKVSQGAITLGAPVQGTLDGSDALLYDDSYFEEWTFRPDFTGNALLTLRSTDFDTYLSVGRGLGLDFEEISANDDSGGGTDSRLGLKVVAGREYTVRVNALNDGERGRYELAVTRSSSLEPAAEPAAGT